jgi:hypothetical protein
VIQYVFFRLSMAIAATTTQFLGRYCELSPNPAFAHFWTRLIVAFSVIAVEYALTSFYLNIRTELSEHQPFRKFFCINLIVFFTFWQMILIDVLTSTKIIKPSSVLSLADVKLGINALLVCFEMMLFAVLNLFAFPWGVYQTSDLDPVKYTPLKKRRAIPTAIWDVLVPIDIVKAVLRGQKWVAVGHRHREQEANQINARAKAHASTTSEDIPSLTPLPAPGSWSGGVYDTYNAAAGGLIMVEHPTPSDEEPIRNLPSPPSPPFGFGLTERNRYDSEKPPLPGPDVEAPDIRNHPAFSKPSINDSPNTPPFTPLPYPIDSGMPNVPLSPVPAIYEPYHSRFPHN